MTQTQSPRSASAGERIRGAAASLGRRLNGVAALGAPTQVALAALIFGAGLRLWHFASGRSLWLDEAMVASSIVNRDWAGLLQPLDYHQIAPIGWLFLEKAAYVALGGADIGLRLPAFVFGLAALGVFAMLARRLFTPWAFAVSTTLFALSPQLIRFSGEAKPYGVDVFVAVAALFYLARFMDRREPLGWLDWAGLTAFGVLAVTVSFPAAFVLAGLGGILFLREVIAKRPVKAIAVAAASSVWLLVFVTLQLGAQESAPGNVGEMQSQWDDSFAPLPPTGAEDAKWYVKSLFEMFVYMFGSFSAAPAALAAAAGVFLLLRRKVLFGAALLMPAAVALVASGLHLYPFRDRLLLFLLPYVLVFVGFTVSAVVSMSTASARAGAAALAVLGFGSVSQLWGEFTYFPRPFGTEHIEPVLREIAQRRSADEPIYVDHSALPAFRHYRRRSGLAGAETIEGQWNWEDPRCLLAELEQVARRPRAWVLYSHSPPMLGMREDAAFLYLAQVAGRPLHTISAVNVQAFLYEFRPDAPARLAALRNALPASGSACGG